MSEPDDGLAPELRFRDEDDALHPVGNHWAWTETSWWSFNVPERALGGWLYTQLRPNQRSVVGGAFVWDATAHLPWELPFYCYLDRQPLPDDIDLRDVSLPNGVRIEQIEPGRVYQIRYRYYAETDFIADLRFEGLMAPFPFLRGAPPFLESSHFDQPGRVTGTLELRGETIEVDCLSVRDRSWGPRPERWGRGGRLSYCFGTASEREAFLAFCVPDADEPDVERLTSGYLLRDGVVRQMKRAVRRTVRDAALGTIARIEIEGVDVDGRELHAVGEARSRMVIPRSTLTWNSLLHWKWNGVEGWGEDQDLWPAPLWADRERSSGRLRGPPRSS